MIMKAYLNVDGIEYAPGAFLEANEFVVEDGRIYSDSGNRTIRYIDHVRDIEEWDGNYDGEVEIYDDGANWKVKYFPFSDV